MATVEQLVRIRIDDDDLQRSAATAEQELDQAVAKRRKVPRPDTSAVTREFARLARELDAVGTFEIDPEVRTNQVRELAGLVDDIGNTPIRLDADGSPAAAEVRRIADSLRGIDDAVVVISGDNSELAADIRQSIGLVESIERIKPVVDFSVQDQALKAARGLVEDLNQNVEIEVDADTSGAEAEFAQLVGSLDVSGIGNKITDSITGALSTAGPAGAAASAAGVAIGGLFIAGFTNGIEREAAADIRAARFGITDADAAANGRIAGEIYGQGFGEGLSTVSDAVAGARAELEQLGVVTDAELTALATNAVNIEQVWGISVNETFRATAAILSNDLADSATEANDAIASILETGVRADDIVDTFSEYSNQLDAAGVSAVEFAQAWELAAESGARSTDGLADVIKETNLRITEGTDASRDAIRELGLDYERVQELFASGRGEEGLALIAERLTTLQTETDKQRILQELMGGSYEQVGVRGVEALSGIADSTLEVEGATERLAETLTGNTQNAVNEFRREWESAFNDFSDGLIESLASDSSGLEAAGEDLGRLIGEAVAVGITDIAPTAITTAWADVLPAIVDGIIPEWEVAGFSIGDAFVTGITGPAEGLANLLRGDLDGAFDAFTGRQTEALAVTNQSREAIDSYAVSAQNLREQNSLGAAAAGAEELADASAAAAEEVAAIERAFDDLTSAIASEFDFSGDRVFRDLLESTDGLVERFGDLSDVQVDFRGQIDQTTPSGRALAEELEGLSGIQQDLIESTRQGSTSAQEFAERSALLEQAVRAAGESAGLARPEIDALVERYLELSSAPAAQLAIEIDEAAIARFRAQLDALSETEQVRLGFDIDDSAAIEAAARANQLFESLSTSIPVVYDVNDDGLLSAIEATIGFNGLVARADLGFDFDNSGSTSAQEAADAFALGQFFADLGFDVNFDGITDAEERAAAFDIQEALADLGYDLDLSGLQQAEEGGEAFGSQTYEALADVDNGPAMASIADATANGDTFGQTTFEATADTDNGPANAAIGEATATGDAFARTTFQAAADVDESAAIGSLAQARQSGQAFANDVFTATATVIDNASSVLDQIARNRTSTITASVVRVGPSAGGGNTVLADGGILGPDGVHYMRNGGTLEGIAKARPGGVWGTYGGNVFNMAENGGDEAFFNSKSPLQRQIDIIERFDRGRLDRGLREHYTNQAAAPNVFNVHATTPVADPVLAGEEIARAVARRQARERRNQPARQWGPT